ncbi:Uncharacterised protein [Klebsiella variicola]|uniref:Uncharacterized protein n=1 Tax=Klebsiella variicola TaxID=244366 RepID=A0A7H4MCE3_KLEVA|nr:Uncharacterised protein [Klebsiella variicola]
MKFKHMLVSALLVLSAQALAEPAPPIKVETSNQVHPAGNTLRHCCGHCAG